MELPIGDYELLSDSTFRCERHHGKQAVARFQTGTISHIGTFKQYVNMPVYSYLCSECIGHLEEAAERLQQSLDRFVTYDESDAFFQTAPVWELTEPVVAALRADVASWRDRMVEGEWYEKVA